MGYTNDFYNAIRGYTEERRKIEAAYKRAMEEAIPLQGSKAGREAVSKAEAEKEAATKANRANTWPRIVAALEGMEKTARAIPLIEPTENQLNILRLLKMRDKVSVDEIKAAANSLRSCPSAMEALKEIARASDHYYGIDYTVAVDVFGTDMALKTTEALWRTSRALVNDKMEYCTRVEGLDKDCTIAKMAAFPNVVKQFDYGQEVEYNAPMARAFALAVDG